MKLTIKQPEWDERLPEFIAIGTGVVHGAGHAGFRAHDGGRFTSNLSGQDFWLLLYASCQPLGMVMGSFVDHVAHRDMLARLAKVGRNVGMENFTSAMYEAREIAVERMQTGGVVGVDIHKGSRFERSRVIESFAIGTAVPPLDLEISPAAIAEPVLVLSINDRD